MTRRCILERVTGTGAVASFLNPAKGGANRGVLTMPDISQIGVRVHTVTAATGFAIGILRDPHFAKIEAKLRLLLALPRGIEPRFQP